MKSFPPKSYFPDSCGGRFSLTILLSVFYQCNLAYAASYLSDNIIHCRRSNKILSKLDLWSIGPCSENIACHCIFTYLYSPSTMRSGVLVMAQVLKSLKGTYTRVSYAIFLLRMHHESRNRSWNKCLTCWCLSLATVIIIWT